jgi:(p)ppGpp synthase/HD superfamily hydrolase
MDSDLAVRAREYARKAHEKLFMVTDEGVSTPHFKHLEDVATLVHQAGGSEEQIAAAWLHDAVEDTSVTIADVRAVFGDTVADMVHGLTDLDEFNGLPLAKRKPLQAKRIVTEPKEVQLIKLADQTANVTRLSKNTPRSMTAEERALYPWGAKQIVDAIRGINPQIEALFDVAYNECIKRYGVPKI